MIIRRVVLIAGWVTLILLPAIGAAISLTSLTMSLRVAGHMGSPVWVTYVVLVDMMPGLLLIGAGLALGSVCLLLAAIDRRLTKLEARA